MCVTENRGLSGPVAFGLIGAFIGALIIQSVWHARRITALEARPPVIREMIAEKLYTISPEDFHEMMKQKPAEWRADDEDHDSDEDLLSL